MAPRNEKVKAVMQIVISLLVLLLGILVLTAPNVVFPKEALPSIQKMAAGWIGLVIGYWLA